ncbi:MAG TPA: NAD(P)H-binding protein [Gemmatimonadales bacterium]|jgi:uncharacterized protein YbjT (DUF2867 family)
MERTALVLGATGLVGRQCVDLLLADPAWTVVRMVGRRHPDLDHPRLERVTLPIDAWTRRPDAFACDVAFCALGTTIRQAGSREAFRAVDFAAPLAAARAARERGASGFVLVSSTGASSASRVFYLRVKGELEDALKEMDFGSLTVLRPSLLLGRRSERRVGEAASGVVLAILGPLLMGRLRRWRGVDARTVAAAMVAAAGTNGPPLRIIESEEIGRWAGASS